jgi:hypothetical protein
LLLVFGSRLLVAAWVVVAIALPWTALSIVLRMHRDTWGRERKYVDLWSIPHAIGGVLLGLFGVGVLWVLALTVWWEVAESWSRVFEHVTNRVTDVVIAVAGCVGAELVLTGAVRLV